MTNQPQFNLNLWLLLGKPSANVMYYYERLPIGCMGTVPGAVLKYSENPEDQKLYAREYLGMNV